MRRETPEMNVSRGVHNRSIFVLIPTPSHLRVTVVQRRQQNRENLKIHSEIPPNLLQNCPVNDNRWESCQQFCARSLEKLGWSQEYPLC